MECIEKTIEVESPLNKVYNQWTQFEDFPKFMEGVERVQQLDNKRLHWVAHIGGKRKEWDAEIFEQVPDERVAWRSISGARNSGIVTFEPLGENRTRVSLKLNYDPEGVMENVAEILGLVGRRIEGDLMLARGDAAAAQACWRRAIDIARAQGAASWELRVTTRLAGLLFGRGSRDEAISLLAAALAPIDGGRDTADVVAAGSLLRKMGENP